MATQIIETAKVPTAEKDPKAPDAETEVANLAPQEPIVRSSPQSDMEIEDKRVNFNRVWIWLRNQTWDGWSIGSTMSFILGLVLSAVFVFTFIRPLDGPEEQPEDNAALAWNAAISRLGIKPLYPPQEDFKVGDIYVTLDDPENKIAGQTIQYPSIVYKGRSVRVGHIDMQDSISKGSRTFRFTNTKLSSDKPSDKLAIDQDSKEVALTDMPGGINLTLVSFPGITVRHYINSDTRFWRFSAARRSGIVEEITIPQSETYSIPAVDAARAIVEYCSGKLTASLCTEEVARTLLAFSFGRDVEKVYDGKHIFPVTISFIYQVFLTRELKVRRYRADSLSAALGENTTSQISDNNTPPTSQTQNRESLALNENNQSTSSAAYWNRQFQSIATNEIFGRPVAFGFRAVSITLKLKEPKTVTEGQK